MAKQQPRKPAAASRIIPPVLKPAKKSEKKNTSGNISIFSYLEAHFNNNQNKYLIVLLFLAVLFSFLSFDNKISTANDDALYIEAASGYAKNFFGYFYTETAPLYPIVLSLVVKIFGVRLFILKLFSILFFTIAIYSLFRAFRERIPYLILIPSLLLTTINYQFLIYTSLTYTETFSLMIFSISFYIFFKIFDRIESKDYALKSKLLLFLIIGFVCFIMLLTRNVALATLGVLILFFIYRKKYLESVLSVVGFSIFYVLYQLALKFIWHLDASQFSSQGNKMFNKDAYQPQLGKETLWGFVERFWGNCQIYISSRFYHVLGFREEMSENNITLTLFSIALILLSVYLMHKRKQFTLLFSTLFYCGLLAATFISLHTSWGQTRLIMIYLPLILFSFFYVLYFFGTEFEYVQSLYPLFFFILLFTSMNATLKQSKERFPVFMENLTGDATFGYTPDWQNYIKMSKWCAQNLPGQTRSVAVRKAPMSFIFSNGNEFYPIYNTPTSNPDSLLIPLRNSNVKYLMTCKLRADPSRYLPDQYISTMHRYAYYIAQKYPNAFQLVHQEGNEEEAQLYKINYDYIDSLKAILK